MAANPFFEPNLLPFGYPDFAAIREEHFLPAFIEGMARQRAEVDAIAADPAPPTFDNTIVALERSGDMLRRVSAVFFTLVSSCSTEGIREIEAEVAPLLAAHDDAITLDPALFARIEAVDDTDLDAESRRLLERYRRDAVRAGARLAPPQQERLREINAELSPLTTEFGTRLLDGRQRRRRARHRPRRSSTAWRPTRAPPPRSPPAPAASTATSSRSCCRPSSRRFAALHRPRAARAAAPASVSRGLAATHDTRRRSSRSSACAPSGRGCWASRTTRRGRRDRRRPGPTAAIDAMLGRLAPVAVAQRAREEADAAVGRPPDTRSRPWDWRAFHAERVRRERYDVDAAALRPYFELERVLQRRCLPRGRASCTASPSPSGTTCPATTPTCASSRSLDEDGSAARPVPRRPLRPRLQARRRLDERLRRPVAPARHPAGRGQQPQHPQARRRRADAAHPRRGHAPCSTSSATRCTACSRDVRYPHVRRHRACRRDFVEYPSQVNEMWLRGPRSSPHYATHHETGEPLPAELVDEARRRPRRFNQGFATSEYLAAALLDQAWHRLAAG